MTDNVIPEASENICKFPVREAPGSVESKDEHSLKFSKIIFKNLLLQIILEQKLMFYLIYKTSSTSCIFF